MDKYDQSKYYEYGTHYAGKIYLDGIHNPYEVTYGTYDADLSIVEGNIFEITIDANREQSGIYVGVKTDKMYQPVLYGKWNVVSLVGTVD